MNIALKATGDISELEKIHPVYLLNKTWKWRKVCVTR